MFHDGWSITVIKSKANVFKNQNTRVSKLTMSQADWDLNRQSKKRLYATAADDKSCPSLRMGELLSAIKKTKFKVAAGPDNIPTSFLKSLGPLALQEMLSIFNSSFSLAQCPRIWRVGAIIVLLKARKSPSEIASFCPINLTFCVVKHRFNYTAKTKNLFSRFQAGYCKGWYCKDQITQIVQAIEDFFQQRLIQRSVLTLQDFSKAYNTVWKENLLLHMLDTGIPSTFVRWVWSFFNDHRARAQLCNLFSSSRHFTKGLPQGSILSPFLFLFYTNNLASLLNNDAVIALFADDVSILATAWKKEDAKAAAQSVVNSMLIRCQEWKLNLNPDKSKVRLFSTWSNDSSWQHALFLGTQKVPVNVTPRLLGVILDRSLAFNVHLKKLTMSLSSSLRIIRAHTHTSWGWHPSNLKSAFHALIHRKLEYASPTSQPWLSTTNHSF